MQCKASISSDIRARTLSLVCVWRWQKRYIEEGVDGLFATRRSDHARHCLSTGRQPLSQNQKCGSFWTLPAVSSSPSSVGRIWYAASLKPHRVDASKVSNGSAFEENITDIVGLL